MSREKSIYGERKRVLYGENLRDSIVGMIGDGCGLRYRWTQHMQR